MSQAKLLFIYLVRCNNVISNVLEKKGPFSHIFIVLNTVRNITELVKNGVRGFLCWVSKFT